MTDFDDTADTTREMKAEFTRVLIARIRAISSDPKQTRALVYELARVKLMEQFPQQDTKQSRQVLRTLENAILDVEWSFAGLRAEQLTSEDMFPPDAVGPEPPPVLPTEGEATAERRIAPPDRSVDRSRRSGSLSSVIRLAMILLLVAVIGAAVVYWPRMKNQVTALLKRPSGSQTAQTEPMPGPRENAASEANRDGQNPAAGQTAKSSMPLPTTFGVYALSDGELQELKALPGKVPDRRVAISAPITTPSATILTSGDVRFIVFRPDGGVDASGTEVRVVAKVSRAMGVDATGKAAMMSAGDSWVIRSMSFPYKVGPVEEQPKMLLLQAENDGSALTPGRYVVVVKGIGYDFTVAGEVKDPNQCVERINATNGAFYSPCPPRP